jgi:DnaK suppressor protein
VAKPLSKKSQPVKKKSGFSKLVQKGAGKKSHSSATASHIGTKGPGPKPGKIEPWKSSVAAQAEAAVEPMFTVPPTSVPTDGKPRKNRAGLSSRELESFRTLLLEKRRQLTGDMHSMERDALGAAGGTNLSNLPIHMADMGTDNYEQEFTLGLMEKDRTLLKEINHALAKIQDGSYGICEGTNQPISKVRLEAQPWARYSIDYARKRERGLIRPISED